MQSWLRHSQRCDVVQTNWKLPPHRLDASSTGAAAKLGALHGAVVEHFEQGPDPLPIFKGRSLAQWLKQGEIDALGLCIERGRLRKAVAVDVAFHEGGLLYGPTAHATAGRVAKKLLRSALMVEGPLELPTADVVFASPRVQPKTKAALEAVLGRLVRFGDEHLPHVRFRILVGEDFEREVLDPVIQVHKAVADTSELFLRSYQLLRLFRKTSS